MKTIEKTVNGKTVRVDIERMPLQKGQPYEQILTATCGDHKVQMRVSHHPTRFNSEDARKEIDRFVDELAARAAGMSDVGAFLDEFHGTAAASEP